jgi:putative ABC transport system ATP-binding protein
LCGMAETMLDGNPENNRRAASQALLRAEGLRRVVDGTAIVRDASFALRTGEAVAITGPSGAGKSSLLRLLNRLDAPTAGRVWLEGVETGTLDVRQLRRRVGMVMQQANLFPGTVAGNVGYGPGLVMSREAPSREVKSQEATLRTSDGNRAMSRDEIEELLATVGLSGYAERDVAALSGGEAQRVSLARTLANRPLVLLLDEPTSALDEAAKQVVEEALRAAMAKVAGACLIVTHDAAQAARLAQRTLTMFEGTLRDGIRGEDE